VVPFCSPHEGGKRAGFFFLTRLENFLELGLISTAAGGEFSLVGFRRAYRAMVVAGGRATSGRA